MPLISSSSFLLCKRCSEQPVINSFEPSKQIRIRCALESPDDASSHTLPAMNHVGQHTNGGTHNTSSDSAAAIQGASLAFQKKKPPAPPKPTARDNGAFTAANASSALSAQNTGGSIGLPDIDGSTSRNIVASRLQQLGQHQHPQYLSPPSKVDPKSPSFIAATLAASRSVSPSPKSRTPRRRGSAGDMSIMSAGEAPVDSMSIPPTGSLISMFEASRGDAGRRGSPTRTGAGSGAREEGDQGSEISVRSPKRKPAKPPVKPRSLSPSPQASTLNHTTREGRPSVARPKEPPSSALEVGKDTKSIQPPAAKPKPRVPPPQAKMTSRPAPGSPPSASANKSRPEPTGDTLKVVTKPTTPEPRRQNPPKHQRSISRPVTELPALDQEESNRREITKRDEQAGKPMKPAKLKARPQTPPPQPSIVSRSQTEVLSPKPTHADRPQLPPPTPPQYQKTTSRPSPQGPAQPSPGDPQKRDVPRPKPKAQAPTPPKPRGSNKAQKDQRNLQKDEPTRPRMTKEDRRGTSETGSTGEVFVSAPTSPELSPALLAPPKNQSSTSTSPSPHGMNRAMRPSNTGRAQNLDVDSLSDAIMAGSLASSRLTPQNTGSSLPPPALPPRQRSPRLRQTMRKQNHDSDDDSDRHKRGHRHKLRTGKHSHHEGSRKRWRDEIRPRERKRYEAVWASNRGYLLPSSQSSSDASTSSGREKPIDYANCVSNIIVREIWKRSRLPQDELAEVWDLVDREKKGILGKQDFVVGMWLIDQRLKGRKIPTKVSPSVWGSANGVRIVGPKFK